MQERRKRRMERTTETRRNKENPRIPAKTERAL
jgi:hypothetical protein